MDKNRRKSYTTERKLEIINFAEEKGNRAAGKHFDVDESCIREWRKKKTVLEAIPKDKKSLRFKKERFPSLEKELSDIISEMQKSDNLKISACQVKQMALDIAKRNNIENFVAGTSWCYRFMRKLNLPVRKFTKKEQSLLDTWKRKQESFITLVKQNLKDVHLENLCNIDEVPITFDITGKRIVNEYGKKFIEITTTSFTVVLAATADGNKCAPMVIFKSKKMPDVEFPEGIVVFCNEQGWMTVEAMIFWYEYVWKRRNIAYHPYPQKCLLIFDSQKAHTTKNFKEEVKKYFEIAVVPTGMTKMLQPLAMCANKTFKEQMRKEWNSWMSKELEEYKTTKKMKPVTFVEICDWIINSWNHVTPNSIKNGFRKAGVEYIPELNDYLEIIWDESNEKFEFSIEPKQLPSISTLNQMVFLTDDEDVDGFEDV